MLLLLSRFSHVQLCYPIDSSLPGSPRPWDSPGKNTGVGCHFLLQCMKVKSESEVIQSCPTLSDPVDCSPSGSSVHGIFQIGVCNAFIINEFSGRSQLDAFWKMFFLYIYIYIVYLFIAALGLHCCVGGFL